jgi:hypothetical protein
LNKKINTFFFILGATVVNVLIAVAAFIILLVLFSKFAAPYMPEQVASWSLVFILILSVTISFVVYQAIIKQFTKRIDMEKYFDPIFKPRRLPTKRKE